MIPTCVRKCGPFSAILYAIVALTLLATGQVPDDQTTPPPVKCWSYEAADMSSRLAASDNTQLYFSRTDGKVDAILIGSGQRAWSADLGGEASSDILLGPSHVYLATRPVPSDNMSLAEETIIRALSKDTGVTTWAAKIPASDELYLGSANGNGKILAVSGKGRISALDAGSGAVLWARESGRELSTRPVFGASEVAFGTNQRSIAILSATTGQLTSEIRTRNIVSALFLDNKGRLIWGDDRGTIVSQNSVGGERRWAIKTGGRITYVAFSDGAFLASSLDNFLYMISEDTGNVIWKRRQPGRITAAPLLTDRYAVVLTYGERSSAFIDRSNGKPKNRVALADGVDYSQPPLWSESRLMFVTTSGIEGYGPGGCALK